MNWLSQFGFFASMNPSVLNTVCVVIITLILSYFSLVFGELVPKRVAMQKTEAVARAVSGVIFGFAHHHPAHRMAAVGVDQWRAAPAAHRPQRPD